MNDKTVQRAVGLIASQIEAASSLLKFAADDLADLITRERSIFTDELRTIVLNLQSQAATLDGNSAFLGRLDLVVPDDEEGDDYPADQVSGWRVG